MTPDLPAEADRIWQATLPVLRRRRIVRRSALTTTLGLALASGIFLSGLPSAPDPSPLASSNQPPADPADSSLAILVMDGAGARFAQLSPEELADQDLTFNLNLEPIVTNKPILYY